MRKMRIHGKNISKEISEFYGFLLKKYGYQGWWPVNSKYHPKDYDIPKTESERFEICVGAILTQNTSWKNVEKALLLLKSHNLMSPESLAKSTEEAIGAAIRPSGYYRQKAKKLKIFSRFFIGLKKGKKVPTREELLSLWGIGKETADSILLYAYKKPYFVVDAYTKRIFGFESTDYDKIQSLFHKALRKDYRLYNEYHALIVRHGKDIKNKSKE